MVVNKESKPCIVLLHFRSSGSEMSSKCLIREQKISYSHHFLETWGQKLFLHNYQYKKFHETPMKIPVSKQNNVKIRVLAVKNRILTSLKTATGIISCLVCNNSSKKKNFFCKILETVPVRKNLVLQTVTSKLSRVTYRIHVKVKGGP